ncbi:MAG: YigZ family protein [Oscillospiraceae bacterium]|nr:YigZ family protein [Oscillospiraceae bacterium]
MYKTVSSLSTGEFEDRKSRFIAALSHVTNEDEAIAFIEGIRAANRKARHNVYAYILRDGNITRYTDDGEPSGTAGVPVLELLRREGLTDVCIVVTRYFGGILLGTGGLVRAYTSAAKAAVSNTHICEMEECAVMNITCDYTYYGTLQNLFAQYDVRIVSSDFADNVTLCLLCRADSADAFSLAVTDITNGRVAAAVDHIEFADMNLGS